MRTHAITVIVAAGFAAGCQPVSGSKEHPVSYQIDPACRDMLVAFAEMKLDRWRGLPPCTAADVVAALGSDDTAWQGPYGRVVRYPGRAGRTAGLEVHFRDDRAAHLIGFGPRLTPAEIQSLLGPPEARSPSRLFEPLNEQWIYAARGLTFHVDVATQEPGRVYGYPAMTVEQFKQSDLFFVEAHEVLH